MPFAGGSGTVEDPYIITTVEQLQAMQDDLTAHYALGNDIDASETEAWNDGQGFEPIGPFLGSFDGRGYKITGLYINRGSTDYVGLFGSADGATIKNVDLVDGTIEGNRRTGGIVGAVNSATISHCCNTGSVTGSGQLTGGIVGIADSSATISQCYNTGSVTGSGWNTGGIVGRADSSATISQCYNTGSVTGSDRYIGGVVGSVISATISHCYNTGSVTGSGDSTGGIVGSAATNATIASCYWDTETSGVTKGVGQGSGSGVFGKTTAEMMQRATYVDWDFDEVWYIDEGNDYPRLRWETTGDSGRTKASIIVSAGVHRILYAPLEVTAGSAGPLKAPSIIVAGVHRELRTNLDVISGIQGILEAPIQVEALISSELQAPLTVSAEVSAELRAPLNLDFPILHLHYAPVTVSSDVAGVVRPYPSVVSAGLLNQVLRVPNVVSAGTKGDSEAPLLLVVAPIHKRKHPIVVFPGVRRTSKRPIEFIVLYWYRVPIPPPTYGGDH